MILIKVRVRTVRYARGMCRSAPLVLIHIAAVLAFALAGVLGPQAHVARTGTAMEIVICTESGARTILVDRDGEPVGQDRPCPEPGCPDCLRATDTAMLAGTAAIPVPPVGTTPVLMGTARPAASRDPVAHRARGPPAAAAPRKSRA